MSRSAWILLSGLASAIALCQNHDPLYRTGSSLVLINASVYDTDNRLITGLNRDVFQVFDEGTEVQIRQFQLEDTPLSTVILLDRSRSMRKAMPYIKEALRAFLTEAGPEDDFCLLTFDERVSGKCAFTRDAEAVIDEFGRREPDGWTAFYDGVIAAIERANTSIHPRRAVLILSDGADTHSRHTWGDALRWARESTACLYAVTPRPVNHKDLVDSARLRSLVEVTGGRVFEVAEASDYPALLSGIDIRRQYVFGYPAPTRASRNKWRRVKVQLKPDAAGKNLRVYWRHGYRFPEPGSVQ